MFSNFPVFLLGRYIESQVRLDYLNPFCLNAMNNAIKSNVNRVK